MFLLDTNIISETRKPRPHGAVVAWISRTPPELLFLSAMTIGELQAGVENIRQKDRAKANEIESWIDAICHTQSILPLDETVLRQWAILMHGQPDHNLEDALIAATATVHRLTVVTRNTRHFEPFGVSLLNPFEAS